MTVCNILWNNITQIPDILFTDTDKLDKSAVKFVEGLFKGFAELVVETDITFAAADIFKTTAKWLTGVAILTDFAYWLEMKDGQYKFINELHKKKDELIDQIKQPLEPFRRALIHTAHLSVAFSLLKDCSVELFQYIDKQLGNIQMSFKVIKNFTLIVASALGIYPYFAAMLESTLLDKEGNMRSFQDILDNGIFTEKFYKETFNEKNHIDLINNVTKVYILAGMAIGAPYDPLFFVMGVLLGTTNILKYVMEADKQAKGVAKEYAKNKPDYERIPLATEEFLFHRPVAASA